MGYRLGIEPSAVRGVQPGVDATPSQQLRVAALFDDLTLVQHEDAIDDSHGREAVRHDYDAVQGDLFRLTTAYNGGPGNLAKWERKIEVADDPLLFIESLPSRETRVFIERVLTNFWIYRARLGQPAPSLDAAASGTWPGYAALDGQSQEFARRAED